MDKKTLKLYLETMVSLNDELKETKEVIKQTKKDFKERGIDIKAVDKFIRYYKLSKETFDVDDSFEYFEVRELLEKLIN